MKFLLLDLSNIFHKAKYVARADTPEEKSGLCAHIMLTSIRKAWVDHKADHLVICADSSSWRTDVYPQYKLSRKLKVATGIVSLSDVEEEQAMRDMLTRLKIFFRDSTNCTFLECEKLEADDLIAGWIQHHQNDEHIIISGDSDFYQLLADNVTIFNGISEELHTINGVFKNNKPVMDKKTNLPKPIPDPQWLLFEKCIRGDTGDNIFSAYPNVRTKSTKNKIGLMEAYADKDKGGFLWNNLMQSTWVDHNGVTHKVIDDYNRNVMLIDLSAQTPIVRELLDEFIKMNKVSKNVSQIGIKFMQFCARNQLNSLGENPTWFTEMMCKKYND